MRLSGSLKKYHLVARQSEIMYPAKSEFGSSKLAMNSYTESDNSGILGLKGGEGMDNLAKLMAILKGQSIDKLRLLLRFAEFLAKEQRG